MALLAVVYYFLKLTLSPEPPVLSEFAQSFCFGGTVISYGWYLQSILVIYLMYYLAARFVMNRNNTKSDDLRWLLCLTVFIELLFYIAICLMMGLASTWYETVLSFLAGVVVASFKGKIMQILSSVFRTTLLLLLFTGLFAICFIYGNGPMVQEPFKIILKMFSSAAFCLTCVVGMRLISLENPVLTFLGRLYLETYIIQGVVFLLLRNKYWSLESQWAFFAVAIIGVIVCAKMIKPLTTKFLQATKTL